MENTELKSLEYYISNKIAKILKVDPEEIDLEKAFADYGIDSITAIRMVGELEDYLDIELPSSLLWEYNSVRKLSEYLISLLN